MLYWLEYLNKVIEFEEFFIRANWASLRALTTKHGNIDSVFIEHCFIIRNSKAGSPIREKFHFFFQNKDAFIPLRKSMNDQLIYLEYK